jgi:transposase InsO family protein
VQRFTPLLADAARPCRHRVGDRWQVDETYVKVAGQWRYEWRSHSTNWSWRADPRRFAFSLPWVGAAQQRPEVLVTPVRAPNANAYAERWIRTVRAECLDWPLIVGRGHLEQVLRVYLEHYNAHRPHRARGLQPPDPAVKPALSGKDPSAQVHRRDLLGGLVHEYPRAA